MARFAGGAEAAWQAEGVRRYGRASCVRMVRAV